MVKKKKEFIKNTKQQIYDIYDNIIKNENVLKNIKDITTFNIDFLKNYNFNHLYNSLSTNNKNIHLKINNIYYHYAEIEEMSIGPIPAESTRTLFWRDSDDNVINFKYNFIKYFIKHNKMLEQLKYKINKYELIFNIKISSLFLEQNLPERSSEEIPVGFWNKKIIINYKFILGLIKDDNCIPFWNDKIQKMSDKIFLPIPENLEKINKPLTFDYKNWFDTEHFMNNDFNNNKDNIIINKERKFNNQNAIKSKKIKIYLTKVQKYYINRLFGCYRYFYNRAVQYINNYDKNKMTTYYYINSNDKTTIKNINLKDITNKFNYKTMRKYIKSFKPLWMNDVVVQSHFIDQAFKEASNNYSKCMEKYKKNNKPFDLKLKNKKNKFQTINIEKVMFNIKTNTLFPGITKLNHSNKKESIFLNIKLAEDIKKYKICDSSITCNVRLNEYYINLNYYDNFTKDEMILKNQRVCSIDPGLKTFMTVYSDNYIDQIGSNINNRMYKICKEIDIINSRMNKKNGNKYLRKSNTRRNLKKAIHRKIKYFENLKSELHNKSIKYLTNNYGKIIIPHLDTQGMASKFNSKLARSLYNLSYYKFMCKLKNKCKEYDIELVDRPEYYTSKTCTRCGCIKHDLQLKDRIFNCRECKLKIDRDINASRNIMLRNNI